MIFRVNRLRLCCVIQVVCFVIAMWSILSPPGPQIVFSEQCYARVVVARGGKVLNTPCPAGEKNF